MTQIGLNTNKIANFKSNELIQAQQNPQIQQVGVEPQILPEVQLPDLYLSNIESVDKSLTFKDKLKKWDMLNLVSPWFEHPFMMLGSCAGLAWGVDKFSKSCGGEYEKSLVGKAAKLGDNIENSKFVQSKPFQTVLGWGKSAKEKFCHIFRNSDVINAVRKTPSEAEWEFVKGELLNTQQRVVHDFSQVVKTLKLTEEGFVELEKLGISKTDKEFINKFFKEATTEDAVSNAVQLKRIGLTDDAIRDVLKNSNATEIVKTKQLEKLGVAKEFIEKLEKNPASLKDIVKVRNACQKGKGIRIGAGHQKLLGPFQPFERYIGLDEIGNRLHSTLQGAKTKTGKALATFLQKCHRGFTFGGGKMGVLLFVSPIIVDTILDTKKAEPKDKAGTAAHGLIHTMSWVFTFPLGLSIMHHLAGVQYAGMSPEDVKECRRLIKEFNEEANPFKEKCWYKNIFGLGEKKAANETFQSYGDYKKKLDILKGKLKELRGKNSKNQSLFTKMSKQLGKFLTMDLENIAAYKNGSFLGNTARRIPSFFRNLGGVPLRVGVWAGITMGILDTIINKGIKGCFGNYYDRYKEEENVEAKKEQKRFTKEDLKARLEETQRRKMLGLVNQPINNVFETPESLRPAIQEPVTEKNNMKEENNIQNVDEEISSNLKTEEDKLVEEKMQQNKAEKNLLKEKVSENNEVKTESNVLQPNLQKVQVEEASKQSKEPVNIFMEQNPDSVVTKPEEAVVKDDYNYLPSTSPVKENKIKLEKRDNYSYIPSSENVLKKETKESEATKYIPSQLGAKINKTFDNSGLEAALKRADRAEQRALRTLAGNFDNP